MTSRQARLGDIVDSIGGPLARLDRSLREDGASIIKPEHRQSGHDMLATDAFLQRFQQVTDLALRKLFPRLLAVLEESDVRHPFGTVLDRLDGYGIVSDVSWWIGLNEIRNRLIHEYAMSPDDRAAEIKLAWDAAFRLRDDLTRIRNDRASAVGLRHD